MFRLISSLCAKLRKKTDKPSQTIAADQLAGVPCIQVFWLCFVCGADECAEVSEPNGLKFLDVPKDWIFVHERGFCPDCVKYSGVRRG